MASDTPGHDRQVLLELQSTMPSLRQSSRAIVESALAGGPCHPSPGPDGLRTESPAGLNSSFFMDLIPTFPLGPVNPHLFYVDEFSRDRNHQKKSLN
jgi:hypothetical protein